MPVSMFLAYRLLSSALMHEEKSWRTICTSVRIVIHNLRMQNELASTMPMGCYKDPNLFIIWLGL